MKIEGKTKIILIGPAGKIKTTRETVNLITDIGFDFICNQIGAPIVSGSSAKYCAIGTGTTGADHNDINLESWEAQVEGDYSHTPDTKVFKNEATFAAGVASDTAITEAGLYSEAAYGILLNRQTFGAINKGANDILKIEWTLTLS